MVWYIYTRDELMHGVHVDCPAHLVADQSKPAIGNNTQNALRPTPRIVHCSCTGNSGRDACRASPASTPGAVTVGAVDSQLLRWAYSNWCAHTAVAAPSSSSDAASDTS